MIEIATQHWPVLLLAFATVAMLLKALRRPAMRMGLVDQPGGRKAHKRATPTIGGLAIVAGFATAYSLSPPAQISVPAWIGLAGLAFVGYLDDLKGLRSWPKLMAQLAAALIATVLGGLVIEDLGTWPGGSSMALGGAAIPLTVFALVGFVNAVNMLDGLDGLAGGVVAVMLLWLAYAATLAGAQDAAYLSLLLAAAVLGFLLHNLRSPFRRRASVFMGDAGSLALGFAVAWLAIEISQAPQRVISPVGIAWIVVLPVMDTVSLMLRRLLRGQNPFHADRNHLHHILGRAGFSTGQSAAILIALSAGLGAVGVGGSAIGVPDVVLGSALIAVAGAHYLFVRYAWRSTRALKRLRAQAGPMDWPTRMALAGGYIGLAAVPFAAERLMLAAYSLVLLASALCIRAVAADLRRLPFTWLALGLCVWLSLAMWQGPTPAVAASWLPVALSGLLALPLGWWLVRLRTHGLPLLVVLVASTLLALGSAAEWPALEAGFIQTSSHWGNPTADGLLLALVLMPLSVAAATGLAAFRQRWRARAVAVTALVTIAITLLLLLGTSSRTALAAALIGLFVLVIASAAHGVGQRVWAGIVGCAIILVLATSLLANAFKPPGLSLTEEYWEPVQSAMLYAAGETELAGERYPVVAVRLDQWRRAWKAVAERPLAGWGVLSVSDVDGVQDGAVGEVTGREAPHLSALADQKSSAYAVLALMGGWTALGLFLLIGFSAVVGIARAGAGGHWPLAHAIAAHGAMGMVLAFLFFSPLVMSLAGAALLNGVLALGVAAAVGSERRRAQIP
ncbi:O-antigen ligase family protein [Spiribacter pallidus]|uniref:MraY family glycosyltransferase n=1 Tax=Spiribacter pallidus TaxID=1987936 RepID=A0ABV3TE78_9GAMM